MTRDRAMLLATARDVLRRNDGVAHLRRFVEAGLTGPDLGHLRHLGAVGRARIGWYVDPALPPDAIRAVRVGGVLGCVSAAASYGIFVPEGLDGRLHVSVQPDLTRMRRSDDARQHVHAGEDASVRLHWDPRLEPVRGWRVSPADALLQMAQCATVRWLTAAVGSARNTAGGAPVMSEESTGLLRRALAAHQVAAVDRSDPTAEAAGETFIRLELEDRRIPRRPQAWLTSLYRADLLVDEWLPVESDGVKHHSGRAVVRDRERDAVLAYLGRQPLRFTHVSAVRETAYVGDVIEQVWRRGR
jgi:very-short-patch-repair endonuclease